MSKPCKISEHVLIEMHQFLDNQQWIGQAGKVADMRFIADGAWLKDAAVISMIHNRKGVWDVSLVFAHFRDPLQLLVRMITRCYSEQKARAAAFYIRKEAARDQRGTLQVSVNDLDLCDN